MSLVYIYDLPTFFLCPSIKIHDGATFINIIDFVCCTTSNHAGDNPAKSLKYWKYFPKPPFSVTVPLDKTPESNSFFSIWGHTFCKIGRASCRERVKMWEVAALVRAGA